MKKYLFFIVLILTACRTNKSSLLLEKTYVPPNGYEIEKNVFIDKSEVSNIDWKEYRYWLGRVLGEESNEYVESCPDTTVWQGETILDTLLYTAYYSNYEFDNFPIVGVTQEQAMKYSNWRSDRVLEMLLISSGKIDPKLDQESDTYFTAKRYFSGNYYDYKPDSSLFLVPRYSLPSVEDVSLLNEKVIVGIDNFFENCKKKICKECVGNDHIVNSLENYSSNYYIYNSPTKPSFIDCKNMSFLEVHNLIGNVAEWTTDYVGVYGGSWQDSIDNNRLEISKSAKTKSCAIGFRNICRIDTVQIFD